MHEDFNIKKEANGSNKAFTLPVNANVTDNSLEIRLYWAGKGTTVIPERGNYGPLISAISVCSSMLYVLSEPLLLKLLTQCCSTKTGKYTTK